MLTPAEVDTVLAALKFTSHTLRQRGGAWRRFHRLATQLEARPPANPPVVADCHNDYMTTTDVAAHLGCTPRHARRVAARLGGHQHGRVWLIPADNLKDTTCRP